MYNIAVSSVVPGEFFPVPDPLLDHIDPAILNSPPGWPNPATGVSDLAVKYLSYLDLATTFIDDFAANTLKLLGFDEGNTIISIGHTIPLTICGQANCVAQTNVCLIHCSAFFLLVLVVDKTLSNNLKTDAEAQVIADAIAAFQFNNNKCRDYGLDPLDFMTIPCITMSGTCPTFYLIAVTMEPSNAVITGQHPTTQTQVLQCATVPTHSGHTDTGMEDTEYRKVALKHFLAFKELAKSHWMHILEGV